MKKVIILGLMFWASSTFVNGQNPNIFTYIYDDLNRLTEVQYGNGTVIQYAYDKVGNRTLRVVDAVNPHQPDIAPANGALSLSTVGAGSAVTLTYNNENIGTASTGGFTTLFALSDNATYESGADDLLATRYTSNLTPGAMPLVTEALAIPGTATAGARHILIVADYYDDVDNELSELNNLLAVPITIQDCSGLSLSVDPADETCAGGNGSAVATAAGGAAPYQYTWSTVPPQNGAGISNLTAGNYAVSVLDQNGCQAEAGFTIDNAGQSPVANFGYSLSGLAASFSNTSAFALSYTWDFGDGSGANGENPVHNYAAPGSYSVCLEALNSCGTAVYCATVVVAVAACDLPSGLSASAITQASATLGWNNVAGAVSYNIRYREAGAGSWNTVAGAGSATYALSGLAAATAYEFQVEAVCSGGSSGYSTSGYFSTLSSGGSNAGAELNIVIENLDERINSKDISLAQDGGLVVTGWNEGKIFAARYSPAGIMQWAKEYTGGFGTEGGSKVIPTNEGGFAITGHLSMPGGPPYSMFLLKIDASGNIEWMKTYGGPGGEDGRSLVQNAAGEFVLVGHSYSFGAGESDLWVLKTDSQGNLIWNKTYGDSYLGTGTDIKEAVGGGYLISGKNRGSVLANGPCLIKITETGQTVWSKFYDPDDPYYDIEAEALAEAPNGDIYITGTRLSFYKEGVLLKTNSSGDLQWCKTALGPGMDDQASDIAMDSNNDIILAGRSKISNNASQLDISLLKFNLSGDLLAAAHIYSDDNQFANGCVARNDTVFIAGLTYGYDTTYFTSNSFIFSRKSDFNSSCSTGSFSPALANRLLSTTSFPESGSHAPAVTPISATASDLAFQHIYPCGSPCTMTNGITASETTICQGQTVSLFYTGAGAAEFSWKAGADGVPFSTQPNTSISFSTSGTYTVYLTAGDGNGCQETSSIVLTVQPAPLISISTFDEQCLNQNGFASVDVSAVSNPQILWSTGAAATSISGLAAGNYSVQVSNAEGCSTTQNFTINNTSNGFTVSGQVENVSCYGQNDGAITVSTNGTQGNVAYNWSNGAATNPVSSLAPGQYTVTIADGAGCIETAGYTVEEPQALAVSMGISPETGIGAGDGTATAMPTGGTLPYAYSWSHGPSTAAAISLSEGAYTVTVADARGCAATAEANVFVRIEEAVGVQLFKKDRPGATPDYVQVIDLAAGATIEFDHGNIASGAGTASPYFTREDMDDVWTEKSGQFPNLFSLANGQFFDISLSPAPLAFPVKEGGSLVSEGYANATEFVGEKLFLSISGEQADVAPFNDDPATVANASAPQGIVGLHRAADKSPANSTGRTFAGVIDSDGDGEYEKIALFTSAAATQAWAAGRLHDFGIEFDKILMLDGGGSTQMKAAGTDYVTSTRLIPQHIVVYSAPISGCTDPLAHNYDPSATMDNGSCETCVDGIQNGDETGIDCGGGLCTPCGPVCPDLIVSNLVINSIDGNTVNYTVTFKNIGNETADFGSLPLGLIRQAYASTDDQADGGDAGAGGWTISTGSLAPGAELSFTNNTIIDLATYNYLIVVIDNSDELQECDETNNASAILLCNELLNWFADADGDNYGDSGNTTLACNPPQGYVADNTDCDDTNPNIHPSAPEACDGLDNNCNGMGDEPVVDACGDCVARWSATPAIEPAEPEMCLGTWTALSVDDGSHSSLQFGGQDGAAAFGNPAALQISGGLTIEMWLKPTAFGVRRNPINKAYGGEYTITQWENGHLNFYWGAAGGDATPYNEFYSSGPLALNEWNHVAIVRDVAGGRLAWYINGVLDREELGSVAPGTVSPNEVIIGNGYQPDGYHGNIDEVRIWNTALSSAAIADWKDKTVNNTHPDYPNLAGYWNFDEGTGTAAFDRSGNNTQGTLYDGPLWSGDVPDLVNASLLWSTGEYGDSIWVSPTGNTVYSVQNLEGACIDSATVVVHNPYATAASTTEDCQNANGEALVQITGGNAPYQADWAGGQSGATLTNLTAGLHSAVITDSAGCETYDAIYLPGLKAEILAESALPCSPEALSLEALAPGLDTGILTNYYLKTLAGEAQLSFTSGHSYTYPTEAGKKYLVLVSGVYTVWNGCDYLDAREKYFDPAFFYDNGSISNRPTFYGAFSGLRPLSDQPQPNHAYAYLAEGDGANLSLYFNDNAYGDNCGHFNVELWELEAATYTWTSGAAGVVDTLDPANPPQGGTASVEVQMNGQVCTDLADISNRFQTLYEDADGDGFGNPAMAKPGCLPDPGYVANDLDCDDSRGDSYPGAPELCDGVDNNCDGEVDEAYECSCAYRDSVALVALYNSANGAQWDTVWNLNQPMSTWYGVTVNAQGCVTCLDLDGNANCGAASGAGNGLSGQIPPELGDLSELEKLFLSHGQLTGPIPPELGNLSNLVYFLLGDNELDGNIPPELGNLTNLFTFQIQQNNLTGGIPSTLGNIPGLQQIYLFENSLSGSIPLEIGGLSNLRILHLGHNQLTGPLPAELADLAALELLRLDHNQFHGCYPPEYTAFCSINYDLSNNPQLPWQGNMMPFCNGENQVGAACDDGDATTVNEVITAACECQEEGGLQVSPILYLQGAYDPGAGLMRDDLRANAALPLAEPYTGLGYTHVGGGGESTAQVVLDVTGADATVDWVFLELREGADSTVVAATRSALLQRDGDVVDVDGISPAVFENVPAGDYYLTIRHRNHLGVMSASPLALSNTLTVVDFTSDQNNTYGGSNGIATLADGNLALYSGDFNHNGQVQNTDYSFMVFTLGTSGYLSGDLDLNGQVQNTDVQFKLVPNIGKGQAFPE